MLFLIQFVIAGYIDYSTLVCRCENIINRQDCLYYGCQWNAKQVEQQQKVNLNFGIPQYKTQLAPNVQYQCTNTKCTDLGDQITCDLTGSCAWNNNNQCASFTFCADYTVTDPQLCYQKTVPSQNCIPPVSATNKTYTCRDDVGPNNFYTCYVIEDKESCLQYQSATCVWNTLTIAQDELTQPDSYCGGVGLEQCANFNSLSTLCQKFSAYCVWNSGNCTEIQCTDFKTQAKCTQHFSLDKSKLEFCRWKVDKCIAWEEFPDEEYTRANCMSRTLNLSQWSFTEGLCKPFDSSLSTPDGVDANKKANIKHLKKHTFQHRVSLLDDMDENSELCRSKLKGFYNMLYVVCLYFFLINPVLNYQKHGFFFDTKLLDMIERDFFMCIVTWPLFYAWSHIALLLQYLSLKEIPNSVIFIIQHASQLCMFLYCHYLVLTRNFFMSHGIFITFQSCIFFMKMHSYTMTNYKMRREWRDSGSKKHNDPYAYPNNINFKNFTQFIMIPVLVYETQYPRTEKIRIKYAIFKMVNTVAMLVLAYQICSLHILPTIETAKEMNFIESLFKFTLPMTCLCLVCFNMIFENYTNFWGEITKYGDRLFYTDWWNATNFEEFNRKWNLPVYEFLYRHVYLEMIFEHHFSVRKAQLATFLFSALLHEYSLCLSLQQLTPILILFMMVQMPVMLLTQSMKGKQSGNIFFWFSIIQGVPLILNLYLRINEFQII